MSTEPSFAVDDQVAVCETRQGSISRVIHVSIVTRLTKTQVVIDGRMRFRRDSGFTCESRRSPYGNRKIVKLDRDVIDRAERDGAIDPRRAQSFRESMTKENIS